MATRHCQRCGSCIIGSAALAEIHSSGSSPEATVLCPDCTWLIRSHLQPIPEMSYAARSERPAPAPTASLKGGLDRGADSFGALAGRYPNGAPIRRRSP